MGEQVNQATLDTAATLIDADRELEAQAARKALLSIDYWPKPKAVMEAKEVRAFLAAYIARAAQDLAVDDLLAVFSLVGSLNRWRGYDELAHFSEGHQVAQAGSEQAS